MSHRGSDKTIYVVRSDVEQHEVCTKQYINICMSPTEPVFLESLNDLLNQYFGPLRDMKRRRRKDKMLCIRHIDYFNVQNPYGNVNVTHWSNLWVYLVYLYGKHLLLMVKRNFK